MRTGLLLYYVISGFLYMQFFEIKLQRFLKKNDFGIKMINHIKE